jgi:hypothetical protein
MELAVVDVLEDVIEDCLATFCFSSPENSEPVDG